MRHVLAGIVCLFAVGSLFADSVGCNQPNLTVSGAQGDMLAPCAGAIAFISAQVPITSGSSANGSGAGSGISGTFTVVKAPDKASNALMSDCLSGRQLTITLSDPSSQTTLTFSHAIIASFVQNFGASSTENLQIKYAQVSRTSGGSRVVSSVMGTARASAASIVAVNGDGHSQTVRAFTLTVRPGSTTFNSVQLAPPPPAMPAAHAGMVNNNTKVYSSPAAAAPTESISFSFGKIQVRYGNQSSEYQFSGGQVVNGNLTVSRASYTGPTTVAIHP